MPVVTPCMSWIAVFAVLLTIVEQRSMPDLAIEKAESTPLPTVSATFSIGAPTAIKRSVNTPLFSFAIVEFVYVIMEIMFTKICRDSSDEMPVETYPTLQGKYNIIDRTNSDVATKQSSIVEQGHQSILHLLAGSFNLFVRNLITATKSRNIQNSFLALTPFSSLK